VTEASAVADGAAAHYAAACYDTVGGMEVRGAGHSAISTGGGSVVLLLPEQYVRELMCFEGQVFRALEVLVLQRGTRLDDVAPNL